MLWFFIYLFFYWINRSVLTIISHKWCIFWFYKNNIVMVFIPKYVWKCLFPCHHMYLNMLKTKIIIKDIVWRSPRYLSHPRSHPSQKPLHSARTRQLHHSCRTRPGLCQAWDWPGLSKRRLSWAGESVVCHVGQEFPEKMAETGRLWKWAGCRSRTRFWDLSAERRRRWGCWRLGCTRGKDVWGMMEKRCRL